jgi:colanic acid/amylovoran biosynthesis glycosyltransferase
MDCFIAMSKDMRQDLTQIGCPENKIIVHYYGIDTDRFAYPERTYPEKRVVNILVCGTLEPKKAQDRVLQALHLWEQSGQSSYSFTVTFMGDGPLRPKLESLVHSFGWQDRVRFLGHVPYHEPRLVEEYRQADIFTLPSITIKGDKEGIPGTIVEAMACGLPVVSTYHAGIPEIIVNEENGLLVDEQDLEGLSRALGRLIENRALRERLGRAAACTATSRCRLLSRTRELECVYDQLLAGELPRRASVHKAVVASEHDGFDSTSATKTK